MSTAGTSLKDMWATRPPRIPGRNEDGQLAGVCQGIAVRYQVNASFIRIAFLVLFFIGCIGLLLYALCVLLMPKKGRHSAPIDVIVKPKHPLTPEDEQDRILGWAMILLLACFSSSTIFKFGEAYGLTVPLAALIFYLGWKRLHERYPEPPPGLLVPPPPAADPHPGVQYGHGAQGFYGAPGSHDAHGYHPAAEPELPHNPYTPAGPGHPTGVGARHPQHSPYTPQGAYQAGAYQAPNRNRRRPLVTTGEQPPENPERMWKNMVTALAIITVLGMGTSITFRAREAGWVGPKEEFITDPESIPIHPVKNAFGSITVDLTGLWSLDEPATLDVNGMVGSIEVLLPTEGSPVDVRCNTSIGDTDCPHERVDGDGQVLTLNLNQKIGDIRVVENAQ